MIENIIKLIEKTSTEPSKTNIISAPEIDTQTIIRNLRPVRACQAAKKQLAQPDPKNSDNILVESVNALIEEINTKTPSEKVTKEKNSNSNVTTEELIEIPDSKTKTARGGDLHTKVVSPMCCEKSWI